MSTERVRCIGVRREDKNRWERRAPVSPDHVAELVKSGMKVIVQPSNLRTYNDRTYLKAGAIIQEDLSEADLIIAVKEVPITLLIPGKTYMFFSHTIKAQPANMTMLDEIMSKKIRLMDYERITDDNGKRLVRFGQFAGYAGMIDMIHALGNRLLAKGYSTPLLHIGYSYCYSRLQSALEAVKAMGEEISNFGLPADLCPMTFVFTSEGAVSQGALEVFRLLPHKMVTPQEMVDLVKNKAVDPFTVYGTVIKAEDFIEPNDSSKPFNKADYYAHPENYHSVFVEKLLPSISVIVNCMYWDGRFPRLITNQQMKELHEKNNHRLLGVADISADLQGSIEFLMKTTSIDHPLFVYDPRTHDIYDEITDPMYMYREGILFLAVDNLPTEFPREATQWFGDHLLPFLGQIVKSDPANPNFEDLPPPIARAVITTHGRLTPNFEYISDLRKVREKSSKRVLVLGAGLVAGPALEYLSRNPANTRITLADVSLEAAEKLASKSMNIKPVKLDVGDSASLDALVGRHSVVVCLVPASFNPLIAQSCLRMGVHLVTASYIAPEMMALHEQARAAGLVFLNEMGLDPGIDHLEAMNVINDVKAKGGKIRSFVSWCGGLPAPESSDNPMGYKFSWSPRGVLSAATRPAKYKQEDEIIEVAGNAIFKRTQQVEIFPSIWLEGIPNRDSLTYAEAYGISDASTVFRGTLRYRGFCDAVEGMVDLGLLEDAKVPELEASAKDITWNQVMRLLLRVPQGDAISTEHAMEKKLRTPKGFPSKGYSDEKIHKILKIFSWLGLFSDAHVEKRGTYIDCLCALLTTKLVYEPRDRDMIILHHIFEIEWPNEKFETRTSTLVHYSEEFSKGITVMSNLVGLPIAIAAELILDGVVKDRGVLRPVSSDLVAPMLAALKDEGVVFIHKSSFR
jgi:alpha-aminoadipic semialdehyde synthase